MRPEKRTLGVQTTGARTSAVSVRSNDVGVTLTCVCGFSGEIQGSRRVWPIFGGLELLQPVFCDRFCARFLPVDRDFLVLLVDFRCHLAITSTRAAAHVILRRWLKP